MPYQLQDFDGVSLPLYNPRQDHSPVGASSALRPSIGGFYNPYVTTTIRANQQVISLNGIYWGEDDYVGDEDGNYVGDESGNYVIGGLEAGVLRSQIAALAEKVRTAGPLWRVRLDDDARQWKTASFLRMSQPQVWQDRTFKAEITCEFESSMEYWHAETATTSSVAATAGVAASFTIENAGATIKDAVVTVTRTSGTVSAFSLLCVELGVSWTWTGSIGSGQVLTIDTGARTVIKSGTDSYSGMNFAGHTAASWLPIPQGRYAFTVTVLGGNATVASSHYTQFP